MLEKIMLRNATLFLPVMALLSCGAGQPSPRVFEKGEFMGSCDFAKPRMCQEYWGATDGPKACAELKGRWDREQKCGTSQAVGRCDQGRFVFVYYENLTGTSKRDNNENLKRNCPGEYQAIGQ